MSVTQFLKSLTLNDLLEQSKTLLDSCALKCPHMPIHCIRGVVYALSYGSHSVTCKQHHMCLYFQSQSITALWPVLITPSHGKLARLS